MTALRNTNFAISYFCVLTRFILILLFISMNSRIIMAQTEQSELVQLSNYTFSKERNFVGLITFNGKPVKRAELSGAGAHVFKVSGSNKLSILPRYSLSNASYDLVIAVKTPGGTFNNAFKIIDDAFLKNKVIAHRGAWKNTGVPENSIASLQHAINLGCAGSEFDVHMSADSVLVINHDPIIQGKQIETSTAEELAAITLSNAESLPTLEKYLSIGTKQNKTKLILEIKPSAISKERGIATTRKVVELVQKLKAQAWIDYISFDYDMCREIIRLDPFARVAYLNGDKTPKELKHEKFWGFDYNLKVLRMNEPWIKAAHDLKLTTDVWTVNDKESLEWFLTRDVNFITTNEPELLFNLLNNK